MFFIKKLSKVLITMVMVSLMFNWNNTNASKVDIFSTISRSEATYNHYSDNNYGYYKNYYDNRYNISSNRYGYFKNFNYQIQQKEVKEEEKPINYNPENLRELSNLTKEQIAKALQGCQLEILADYYYEIEKQYNINVFFLMALNIEESGHGKSYLAQNNYNLGGVKSRDGSYAVFGSWQDSLEYIASLIDEMYLTETGAYYNGTSVYSVNIKYSGSNKWANNINTIAYELLDKIQNN